MDLPVMPPVKPMLAKPAATLPAGWSYDPKWDGFRSIVFRDGDEVELGSRNEKPMTRYFPELVVAALAELPERCVVDGEIVLASPDGSRLDFEALGQRIHPAASRVRMLSESTPAAFVAFDLLALGDDDLTGMPFRERRARLESILPAVSEGSVHLSPLTDDAEEAMRWFTDFEGAGLDGIIGKDPEATYQPNKRVLTKLKHTRTADTVVAGYRTHKSGDDAIGSLLLGIYTDEGRLAHVGVSSSFTMARRRELFTELQPLVTDFEGHPWDWAAQLQADTPRKSEGSRWAAGKDLSFTPLRPERVVEVKYDYLEGDRFRHTAQFLRWREDREPRSCTYDQLDQPVDYPLAQVLGAPVVGE
ncbi:ATP-dependent DNA ligase LigC [Serinicoccus hydrothermalis]|uniref:DNA ligase (ATP) n=1 Tax=Serinicoccus hydrothermalis TaxID=1758689 RepID=A0A1B1N8Z8_9MICO|nr:ATP-dependent DNA ligase [Serinicoccus hydrothermalis]ANS77910.1 ATP-dependent DNA ligase LigC [Serinicoccus hydrothermalis]